MEQRNFSVFWTKMTPGKIVQHLRLTRTASHISLQPRIALVSARMSTDSGATDIQGVWRLPGGTLVLVSTIEGWGIRWDGQRSALLLSIKLETAPQFSLPTKILEECLIWPKKVSGVMGNIEVWMDSAHLTLWGLCAPSFLWPKFIECLLYARHYSRWHSHGSKRMFCYFIF